MADLTPNNREEAWLKGMVDGSTTLTPNNRREHWYQDIINAGGGGGGGGGVLVVHATMTETTMTLDKTWKEIKDAPLAVYIDAYEESGIWAQTVNPIFSVDDDGGYNVLIAFPSAGVGSLTFAVRTLTTDSENGYPSISA